MQVYLGENVIDDPNDPAFAGAGEGLLFIFTGIVNDKNEPPICCSQTRFWHENYIFWTILKILSHDLGWSKSESSIAAYFFFAT